ncbi:hypothetical protein CJI52_02385, partial [Bifidobacteriaceae bacterium WP022]
DAFSFVTKKFAGEWLEPTYESLLASSWKWNGPNRPVLLDRKMNPVLRSLYSGKLNIITFTFLDALQFMLVAFTALFLCVALRKKKSISCEYFTPLVIVLGMAVLYLVWEAQSQYILPAYLLMIPFAARGFDMLLSRYENRAANNSNAANPSNN